MSYQPTGIGNGRSHDDPFSGKTFQSSPPPMAEEVSIKQLTTERGEAAGGERWGNYHRGAITGLPTKVFYDPAQQEIAFRGALASRVVECLENVEGKLRLAFEHYDDELLRESLLNEFALDALRLRTMEPPNRVFSRFALILRTVAYGQQSKTFTKNQIFELQKIVKRARESVYLTENDLHAIRNLLRAARLDWHVTIPSPNPDETAPNGSKSNP